MSFFSRPALTAVLSVATAACIFSDPTGISRDYALITPEATTLEAWLAGNVLVVELRLSELNVVIPDDVRIPVSVRSASGDVETVLLRTQYCEDSEYSWFVCGEVVIDTAPEALETLVAHLREFHAFIKPGGVVIPSGQPSQNQESLGGTAVIAYFPYGTMKEILNTVRQWPGVRRVEPSTVGFTQGSQPSEPGPLIVSGYMAIEEVPVSPGNLFLEAVANDELHVEYSSSSGSVLRKEIVFAGFQ
jgi:hypothetical protein